MRIVLIIGTRPEAIKCFPLVEALKEREGLEVLVCITGQHREILDDAMEVLGMTSDFDLRIMRPAPTLADITCDVLEGVGDVLKNARADLMLVQGDTTTAMASSLAAFYAGVPLGHVEAGLLTGTKYSPYPEEMNRRMVSLLADLHFAPTPTARANLLRANVPADHIHVTGNTVIDTLLAAKGRLEATGHVSPAIEPVLEAIGDSGRRLILVTAHRRENWGEGIDHICEAVKRLADRGDVHIALPVHPNPKVSDPIHRALAGRPEITLLEPIDYVSFVDLMRRSHIVLTDSGGVQEEAPVLGKPVLVLRDTTERPEGIEAGAARLVGLDATRIVAEAERLLDSDAAYQSMSRHQFLYGDGKASQRIVDIIAARGAHRPTGSREQSAPRGRTRVRERELHAALGASASSTLNDAH